MSRLTLALLPVVLALTSADLYIYEDPYPLVSRNTLDESLFRVPEGIDPVHYEVEITPYFEDTVEREAFTFDGIVTINITVQEPTSTIALQDNVRQIIGVTLTDANGAVVLLDAALPFERARDYQLLYIYTNQILSIGDYVLRITYLGFMNETPLSRGMFRGSYVGSDGRTHWYAATHLQPTHSRQLFPSWDEPGFKSTFRIIVNRPAHFTETFSNMKINSSVPYGDRVRETFNLTPRMSAYLVTIHISEEFTVIADNNDPQRSYRILARPNAAGQGQYALDVGVPLTAWLEDYLNISYYTMGEDMKNDQIASPAWASGATENWGLVTYRELRLLYEEGETNYLDRQSIATITAHELAHKWFGNLVTCRWWDNVWINEGYASYFEYFAMHGVDPSLELGDQFNLFYVQSALSSDSSAAARALEHEVNTPAQVTGHFADISYSKGASVLNMLNHFLTDATFRKSLYYFLNEMQYEHAFPADVFRNFVTAAAEDGVLSAFPSLNLTDFLYGWVTQPGSPVLNVEVDSSGLIRLTQERFYINPLLSSDQLWSIPITFTTQSSPDWQNTRASHVMTGRTMEITKPAGDEWVIFNVRQNALYRVNYDEATWQRIATALQQDASSIHYLNRAQIVDDVFALMRSEKLSYSQGFQVLDFLKTETNFFVWYPAITGFSWLRNRFLHLPDVLAEFDTQLLGFLDAVLTDLGYDQDPTDSMTRIMNRFYLMNLACNVGHEGCVRDSVDKFERFMNNQVSVNPNLRRHVYCSGLRQGGYAEWQRLYQKFQISNNQADGIVTLRGLGCSTNSQAINEYLELILSDAVRAQDRVNGFSYLFIGDRGNARRALPFVQQNYARIEEAVVGTSRFASVLASMASYMDEEGLDEMEEWLLANQNTVPGAATGLSSIASARTSMDWGTRNADIVLSAVRGRASLVVPTLTLLMFSLVSYVIS